MGSAHSSNTTETINNTVQTLIQQTLQQCSGPISQEQVISIRNSKNVLISGVNMNQYASVNMNCAQKTFSSADFNTQMQVALKQAANSKAAALNASSSTSSNNAKIVNTLTQTIQNVVGQTCTQSILQSQALLIDSAQNAIVQNVTFNESATAFIQCLQQNSSYNTLVNNLAASVDQTATSETTGLFDLGLGSFGNSSSSSSSSSSSLILCLCLLYLGFTMLGSGGQTQPEGGEAEE